MIKVCNDVLMSTYVDVNLMDVSDKRISILFSQLSIPTCTGRVHSMTFACKTVKTMKHAMVIGSYHPWLLNRSLVIMRLKTKTTSIKFSKHE